MAKLNIVCGLILIFAIHQITAPNNATTFRKLKEMITALQDVGVSDELKKAGDDFKTDLTNNAAYYSSNWQACFDSVTTIAGKFETFFAGSQYFANDEDKQNKRNKIKTAIGTFIGIFAENDTASCPGYAKWNEILTEASK